MPLVKWLQRAACPLIVFLWTLPALGDTADPFASTASVAETRQAVQAGTELERTGRWVEAVEHYEKALKEWPDDQQLQYGLRRTKVQFSVERRYSDKSFRGNLAPLSRSEAFEFFDDVLTKVRKHYVEPISSTSFVAHGTESLYLALANEKFVAANLAGADTRALQQLRRTLREHYWNRPVASEQAARQTINEVCDLAQSLVGLRSGAVVMEYIFGGCNALDDYSSYLTPTRLNDLFSNIHGEFVGIGIEMKAESGKGMLLVNVLPESPAWEGGLQPGEYIVGVDGVNCRDMATEEAAGLLQGQPGTRVKLAVAPKNGGSERAATLTRRAVKVKSIPVARIIDPVSGIGYIRMTGFQESTTAELDTALQQLQQQGMQALVWDLRGNPGGLLNTAVEVLDRFIDDGVLVSTRGRRQEQNLTYTAHRFTSWSGPLVLLVDGDSASASEIVAGAVRDHHRGTIVGRKTFGKWSVQSILEYPRGSTGLRLTTAKFYSPAGKTHGKVGVEPDVHVAGETPQLSLYSDPASGNDRDLEVGTELLRKRLTQR